MSSPLFFRLSTLLVLSPLSIAALGAPNAVQENGQTKKQETPSNATDGRILKLTLEDAVRIALNQNIDLEVEHLSTEIARHNARGSWGSFDPVASLTTSYRDTEIQGRNDFAGANVVETDNYTLDGSLSLPFVSGGSLSLTMIHSVDNTNSVFAAFNESTQDAITLAFTQPLLRGAWRRYATTTQREQKLSLLSQQTREDQVRADLIRNVYNAYWDLVSAIEGTGVRELAVQRGLKQLEQDRRRLDLGAGTEVDVLQAETNVAQQEEALLQAIFNQRQAEDTLRQLVFQDRRRFGDQADDDQAQEATFWEQWDWLIEPLTSLPKVKDQAYDWLASFDRALEQRPELIQSRLSIDSAKVSYDSAYSNYLPQLDFNASRSSAGFGESANSSLESALEFEFPDTRLSLDFSIPIGNTSAKYALRAADASIRRSYLDYAKQELVVLADVRAAVRDVIYRAEAVNAASKSAALALRQEQAEQLRMEIGLSTTFQVLEFQETLAESNSTLVLAQAAYAKALVGLEHAEGKLGSQ